MLLTCPPQCRRAFRKILSNIISACVGLCVVVTFSEDEAKAGCAPTRICEIPCLIMSWRILQLQCETWDVLRCFAGGFWRWPSSPPALSSASKPILPELHEQHFDTQMPGIARKNWYILVQKFWRYLKIDKGILWHQNDTWFLFVSFALFHGPRFCRVCRFCRFCRCTTSSFHEVHRPAEHTDASRRMKTTQDASGCLRMPEFEKTQPKQWRDDEGCGTSKSG